MELTKQISTTRKALQYYFLTGIIESILAFIYILAIPSDPKNAWLLGYSKSRFLMAGILLIILGMFVYTLSASRKSSPWMRNSSNWLDAFFDEYNWFLPVMLITSGLIIFGTYIYILLNTRNLTTLQGILIRLSPFFLLAATRTLQAILVSIYINYSKAKAPKKKQAEDQYITINPKKIALTLYAIAILLVLANIAVVLIQQATWDLSIFGLGAEFDLNREANTPTLLSSFNLLFAAVLLTSIAAIKARTEAPYRKHWLSLGIIFLLLAIDEGASYHEWIFDPLENLPIARGIFYFGWVLAAFPLLAILVVVFAKFFLHLPRKTQIGFMIAGALYLGGVLGVELIGGWYVDLYGTRKWGYKALTIIEESLELVGIVTFIYTLLLYLGDHIQEIKLRITS
jgi:hypothetical protein